MRFVLLILSIAILSCGAPSPYKTNTLSAGSDSRFKGSVYFPGLESADFKLKNQDGKAVSLSDYKGKTIFLSFTFTHCDDVCPFVGVKMLETIKLLGDKAQNIIPLIISIDPERDTQELVKQYSKEIGFDGKIQYLIGSIDDLKPVWKAYNIAVAKSSDDDLAESAQNKSETGIKKLDADRGEALGHDESITLGGTAPKVNPEHGTNPRELPSAIGISEQGLQVAEAVIGKFAGGYSVTHNIPFWIIDKDQKRVLSFSAEAKPDDMAQDLLFVEQGIIPGSK